MKRKIAMLLCIFLILTLCSCAAKETDAPAETENTIVEISRGDSGEDTNKLAASAVVYTDSFQSADGTVDIEINLDDTSLYEGGFRTLQITPRPFTGEEVQHIARVLFGDAVLYEFINNREATKTELLEQRGVLETLLEGDALKAFFATENIDDGKETIRSYLDTHKVEDAPESVERTVCNFQYKPWSSYYPGNGETADYLLISAQTEIDGIPYCFSAANNTNMGVRVFRVVAYISDDISWPCNLSERLYTERIMSTEEPTREQIDAVREKAEKLIEELNMGQWMIDKCETVEMRPGKETVRVTAVPVYNGIPMLRQPQPSSLRGEEEGIQNCYYPDLSMTFSTDGILMYFEMNTPMEITAVSEETSPMMSFAEMMGSIKTQFSGYSAIQYTEKFRFGENYHVDALIDRLTLGYNMLPVSQCPTEILEYFGSPLWVNNGDFYLVPAVAVYGNFRASSTSPEEAPFDYRQDWEHGDALFTILNAANGSMIAPVNSDMILG